MTLRDVRLQTCTKCGIEKSDIHFSIRRSRKRGISEKCKACSNAYCAEWRATGNNTQRMNLQKMGLTPADFEAMSAVQAGLCAICHKPETKTQRGRVRNLCVDHDHDCCPSYRACTKCVRGLLCQNCNSAIGLMEDDPARLESAADYLRARAI